MKRLYIHLITIVSMTLMLASPCYASFSEENNLHAKSTYNEYLAFVGCDDNVMPVNANNSKMTEYVDLLRSYITYSDSDLDKIGLSDGNKAIIKKLKTNSTYSPTSAELARAAATVKLNVDATVHKYSDSTKIDVEWDYSWTSSPIMTDTDGVAITWSGDYTIDEDNVTGVVNHGIPGFSIYRDVRNTFDVAHNGYCAEFDMMPPGTQEGSVARTGEGSFSLYCYDHGHNACQIQWAYGHSELRVAGNVGVSFSTSGVGVAPNISFGVGVKSLSPDINTFKA